jgi:glucosamine-6-phosphate deaminase
METFKKDKLQIQSFASRQQMGVAAAGLVAARITELLKSKDEVNIIFAAAPSQNDFLAELVKKDMRWQKINALHMDEYIGLPDGAPQRFGQFLDDAIFSKRAFKSVNYINGNAADPEQECERYAALLKTYPPGICCMGIGENTHLAFNDPPVANFNDPYLAKVVELDEACRQQQLNDGCFDKLDAVPKHAITLTIPALLMANYIYCMVPGKTKAQAVKHTLNEAISELCPSTILRQHNNAILFIDADSGSAAF